MLPLFDPFEAGVVDDLLRVFAALVAAAATGGEGGRKRSHGCEQDENAETAQGMGLLVIGGRIEAEGF